MSRIQHADFTRAECAPAYPQAAETPRRVSSLDLMSAGRLLEIEHRGQVYTLRLTRQDKLLLTK